jgi:hypothetical protein
MDALFQDRLADWPTDRRSNITLTVTLDYDSQRWVALDKTPSMFIQDKAILSSERVLHKDYDRKGSVGKKSLGVGLMGLGERRADWR